MNPTPLRFSLLCTLTLLVSLMSAVGDLGPGWHNVQGEPVTPEEAAAHQQAEAPETSSPSALRGPSAIEVDDITVEIEELARGLQQDPELIFEYVHNHIDYVPYYGTLKGATLTLLDRSGNDFDQAALLVALLRESGYTANYKFGTMDVPANALDDVDVDHWLGVEGNAAPQIISNGGIPANTFVDGFGNATMTRMNRVWVEVNIGGTNYLMDPAFKTYENIPGIDLAAATGYTTTDLFAAAGGTANPVYVENLDTTALRNELSSYATNLVTEIRTNHPNAEPDEVFGGRRINPVDLTSFSTTLPFPTTLVDTWTNIPASFDTTVRFQLGTIDTTIPTGTINGQRLSLTFASGANPTATLWLDDVVLAEETGTVSSTPVNLTLSVDHPYAGSGGSYQDQSETKSYLRDGSYAIIYGFGGSGNSALLRKRQAQLDEYRAQGLPDTSREILTESLNVMGLSWMRQTALAQEMIDQIGEILTVSHHRFGRMGQEDGYYVDVGLQTSSSAPKTTAPGIDDSAAFRAISLFASAMEHGVIEQLQDNDSASTIQLLTLANAAGNRIFYADNSTYATTVRPQLTGYSTGTLDYFDLLASNGYVLILPEDGAHTIDDWTGTGYIQSFDQPGFVASLGMIIYGGYFGGYGGIMGPLDPEGLIYDYHDDPTWDTGEPSGVDNPASEEPVDLANGAYLFHKNALAVGYAPPAQLSFTHSYNSRQRLQDSPLGHGWTHNFVGELNTRSEIPAALGQSTPADAAIFATSVLVALDLCKDSTSIQHWVVGSLTAGWAVDQLRGNAVAIQLGSEQMQFVRLADGTYNSPPGVTAQLSEYGTSFALEDRFDVTAAFNANGKITSTSDADGNTITFVYNPDGTLKNVSDGFGHALTLNYNGSQRITTVSDGTGRSVQYGYSPAGDLTDFTDAENNLWTYGYDAGHRITSLANPKLETLAINQYDALDRVITQDVEGVHSWNFYYAGFRNTEEDPDGNLTHYYYDEKGRHTGHENAAGETRTFAYDGQNNLTRITDPLGNETSYEYDGNQNLVRVIDAEMEEMKFVYDSEHRLWAVTDEVGETRTYQYDAEHHRTKIIDELLNETVYTYTPEGFVASITSRTGHTTTRTYDSFGNPETITFPDATSAHLNIDARGDLWSVTNASGNTTTYTYDDRRLLLTTEDELGFGVTNSYDACGNLIQSTDRHGRTYSYSWSPLYNLLSRNLPNGSTITHGYNARNLLAKTVDGMGEETEFTYDPVGRLTQTLQDPSQQIGFSYHPTGQRSAVQNENLQDWTFLYDAMGRLTSLESPLGRTETRTYDARGLLETYTEPSGQLSTYTYNESGRLERIVDPVGQVDYTYHDNQLLHTITEGAAVITRVYDDRDRLSQFTDSSGNTIGYSYDGAGKLTQITYPDSKTVAYTYDDAGRMTTVTDWMSRVTTYGYDGNGRLHTITRPNGTVRIRTYNAAGQLSQIREETSSSALIAQYDFVYDANERVTGEQASPPQAPVVPTMEAMTYDADNRLATYGGVAATHDDDGNMTYGPLAGTMSTFTYDARNRLLTAGGTTYGYDAEDRRISATDPSGATTYVHNPNGYLSQLLVRNAPGSVTTRYVYGLGGLLYEDTAGSTLTYHYDFRGSTIALTNDAETITGRVAYSPFGESLVTAGTVDTPFLFHGRLGVMKDGNGLYHMRARYFIPEIGRFLTADPLGLAGGLNHYAFAGNNPILGADPTGLIVIYVHGTFSDTDAFSNAERSGYNDIFSDPNQTNFGWTGDNSAAARRTAGADLAAQIAEYRRTHPGEEVTVVAHSHGGNVALEATRGGASIDNLVTIGTPSRDDHTGDRSNIGNWFNLYSESDGVQSRGGGAHDWWGVGEWGEAGRQFDGAVNIEVNLDTGPIDTHSDLRIHGLDPLRGQVNRPSKP